MFTHQNKKAGTVFNQTRGFCQRPSHLLTPTGDYPRTDSPLPNITALAQQVEALDWRMLS